MIFLTVGTHEPFDRLVHAVDDWCAAQETPPEVLGQITARAGYQPQHFASVPALKPDEYDQHFRKTEFIISHAGMGSIITALSLQKPIVILPRRGHLQETRNDHQFATLQRFRDKPGIFAAEDEATLPAVLDDLVASGAAAGGEISRFANQELIDALRGFIHEDGSA